MRAASLLIASLLAAGVAQAQTPSIADRPLVTAQSLVYALAQP